MSISTVPAGSFAKASSVGAKTVKGPGLLRVSTRPAALTAATRVLWIGELAAFSTMVLVGYIVAPPTVGSFCAWALREVRARAAAASVARRVFFIVVILLSFGYRSEFLKARPFLQGTHKHLRLLAKTGLVI